MWRTCGTAWSIPLSTTRPGKRLQKELERLSRMAPGTPEVGVSRTYVEWILDLPWGKTTTDNLDLKRARQVLDQDHYGLEKVKERIIEYLAVLRMKQRHEGPHPVLCGPSGRGQDLHRPGYRPGGGTRSLCRCPWAAYATRPRSAATGAPMLARFRGALSPASSRREP